MSENEKLECLKSLQDVLQKKFELESKVENLPANLRAEEAKLKDANSTYLKLTERYNAVNEEVKSLSFRYEDAFTTRTGYEKQMEFINTQREYEALTKQLEEAKLSEQTLLKSRNQKRAELDKINVELDAQEKICEEQKAVVEAERQQISGVLDEIYAEIDSLNNKCIEIKGNVISDELYNKFTNISKKKDGLGIVPVHGQVCTGCDMVLPMQFVIDLRLKQEKNDFDYCPYCSRILWFEKLDSEVEKNFIFEQLESTKADFKSSSAESKQDTDSFDESMGMEEGFDEF